MHCVALFCVTIYIRIAVLRDRSQKSNFILYYAVCQFCKLHLFCLFEIKQDLVDHNPHIHRPRDLFRVTYTHIYPFNLG